MGMGINVKLVILCVLLVAIPGLFLGFVGYNTAEDAVYHGIQDRLQGQAEDWRLLADSYEQEIQAQEARVRKSAEAIVTAQAKMTFELIDEALEEQGVVQ